MPNRTIIDAIVRQLRIELAYDDFVRVVDIDAYVQHQPVDRVEARRAAPLRRADRW